MPAKVYEFKTNPARGKVEILALEASNVKGLRNFKHDFAEKPNCVVFGRNGGGKSSILECLPFLCRGKKGVKDKIDNIVGPYDNKAYIGIKLKAGKGVWDLGEDLFIKMTETRNGSVNWTVMDEATGKIHKTSPRKKLEQILNRYLDPVALVEELKAHNGDKKLAATLAEIHGLDLSEYVQQDERLSEELKDEERELKRQREALKSLVKPQKDWPTEKTKLAEINKALDDLRTLQSRNYDKVMKIAKAQEKANQSDEERRKLAEDMPKLQQAFEKAQTEARNGKNALTVKKAELGNLKKENDAKRWKGRGDQDMEKELAQLEARSKEIRQEQKKKRDFEQTRQKDREREQGFESLITQLEERVKHKGETAKAKLKEWEKEQLKLKTQEGNVRDMTDRVEDLENKLLPLEAWRGERDPEGELFPSEWLKKRLYKAEDDNKLYRLRNAYEQAEQGIKSLETVIRTLKQTRNANQAMKDCAVAKVADNFPHPGMTLDENTIWLDMGDDRGKRTINDVSEGERLKVCCHIIIALNERDGKKLDVLLIREGYKLDADNRQIVYDVAAEHGYKVVLETIETTEAGALRIEAGQVVSVNPEPEDEPEIIKTEQKPELAEAIDW